VLLFIRDLRSVVIAAIAIPTSVIATFTLLKMMNFTLNNMTLLAVTLSVGIVIDDAIVVLENIVRYIEEKDYPPMRAAVDATKEISLAVFATTISLVVIFVPIAFMTGYARRYVNEFGWTMAFSIMVSMLVSFTLTPTLSARLLRRYSPENGEAKPHHKSKDSRLFSLVNRGYGRLLEWSLQHRAVVLLIALATFAMTFPLYNLVGRDWIPPDDQSELNVSFHLPEGTSVEGTSRIGSRLAEQIRKVRGVEFVNPYVHEGGGYGSSNHAHIYVRLTDVEKRSFSNYDVARDLRQLLQAYPNMRSRIMFPSALSTGENFAPISVRILGPDFLKCAELSQAAAAEARKVPGLLDVDTGVRLNSPEFQVMIDRKRAADLGVRVSDVANAIRLMTSGEDQISTYKEGSEQYDVTLQLLPEQKNDPEILSRVVIPSSRLGQVRLDNIAEVKRGLGPARIERFNRQFQISVYSNNAPDFPLEAASQAVVASVNKVGLPSGYEVRSSGNVKMLEETAANLVIALLLASIFMYMVLAAQFESFLHPFTIMLSLPLSIPFALLTLWLTGRTLNLWSALGVLLLLGIVKKNGILQVDYTNKLREQGLPLRDAILEANHVRLRPILMTTLAIVAGLVPTALGLGAGSAQRSAIAVTIIGGQSLCLILTLLVTPVAYSMIGELEESGFFARANLRLARLKLGAARFFS
jgi:HAE1 family hydrophobic/amphiphilic exporter-1